MTASETPTTPGGRRPRRRRLTPDEIEARVRAGLIMTLAFVLGVTVLGMLYSLIYVYQPDGDIAPLDSRFMDVLQPLAFSIGGALTGLAAGGALKKSSDDDEPKA